MTSPDRIDPGVRAEKLAVAFVLALFGTLVVYRMSVAVYEPAAVTNLPVFRNKQALLSGDMLGLSTLRVLAIPSQPQG